MATDEPEHKKTWSRLTDPEKTTIKKLHKQGLTDTRIGEILGRHRMVIFIYRHQNGLAANRRSKKSFKQAYQKAFQSNGSIAKRRWDAQKFKAFLDGAPVGVTATEWEYLKLLRKNGAMNTCQIAAAMSNRITTSRAILRKLASKCFIKRVGHKNLLATWHTIKWSPHLKLKDNTHGREQQDPMDES